MTRSLRLGFVAATAMASALAVTAQAANLVQNGSFEQNSFTNGQNSELSTTNGSYNAPGVTPGTDSGVTGWLYGSTTNSSPYALYFNAATASDTNAANGNDLSNTGTGVTAASQYQGEVQLLDAAYGQTPAPDGTHFVAIDGDTGFNGWLSQTISGLVTGAKYQLSFDWAAVQLSNRTGQTTDQIEAKLGNTSFFTPTTPLTVKSQGFSGWMNVSTVFTATGTSEVLQFLDHGTPNGLPPVALLDGVSLTQVNTPEPASIALLGAGLVGIVALRRRRRA